MAVMVASKQFEGNLKAFSFGYARLRPRNQGKQVFFPFPYTLTLFIMLVISVLLLRLLKRREANEEVELENFLTRRNEGILLTSEDHPGLLIGRREDLARLIQVAVDKQVIERGETPNHIFFLLSREDTNVFSNDVLEVLGDKHVWIFVEEDPPAKVKTRLSRIGRVILFDQEHMKTCGCSNLTLGIIARFLSLISRDSSTNLDHIYHGIPELCTISFSFPIDVHNSLASVLKHQKYFSGNHYNEILQVTNCMNFINDLANPANFVKADTEPFFISFRSVS
jgi:hypothetical protein